MTTLREAAQQALEALEGKRYTACGWRSDCDKAIAALRAALADPVEPVAWMVYTEGGTSAYVTDNPNDLVGAYRALPLYTAPPQRKPEPNSDYERGFVDGMSEQARRSVDKAVNAMTKCKPLAEEEIARLVTNDMVKFAREIERAHDIT